MARPVARPAGHADVPQLVDLMQAFYEEAGFPLDRDWAASAFERLLAHPDHGAAWLIEAEGRPVGHVVLSVRFTMEFGGLSGYVDDLFVRPESRRRGAAAAGLEAVLAECRRRGCRSLHVEVGADNEAARAVYARHGLLPGADNRLTCHAILEPAG
jgi:GNAT superfamily N-acetyltransferase